MSTDPLLVGFWLAACLALIVVMALSGRADDRRWDRLTRPVGDDNDLIWRVDTPEGDAIIAKVPPPPPPKSPELVNGRWVHYDQRPRPWAVIVAGSEPAHYRDRSQALSAALDQSRRAAARREREAAVRRARQALGEGQ